MRFDRACTQAPPPQMLYTLWIAYTIKSVDDVYHKRLLTPAKGAEIYAKLRIAATQAGYLKPTYGMYFLLLLTDWAAVAFSLYLVFRAGNPITVLITSLVLSFFFVHAGGMTHDFGHTQVFRSTKLNHFCGMLVGIVLAVPYKVWCKNHNAHHANTNEQDLDPDLNSVFAFAEEQSNNKTGVAGFIRRNQHWLYYLLGCLGGMSFRLKGLKHLLTDFEKLPIFDILLLLIGIAVWWGSPFFVFPLWKALIVVLTMTISGGFYIANIFAPNHKGMPQLKKDLAYSFFEQQNTTSRNVRGNYLLDYIFLGLNYQVEHHLFPGVSRFQMRNLNVLTEKACHENGLPIVTMGLIETNKFILAELKAVADVARKEYGALKKKVALAI